MKYWIGQQVQAAAASPKGIVVRQWLGLRGSPRANHEIHRVPVPAEIVVYFGDVLSKLYQLEQWLPVLERLSKEHKVLLVFRKVGSLRELRGRTSLPMIFARRFEDLMALYDANDYRVGLYVNNGVNNFQSLTFARMVHIHINHGESDKLSMVSNQIKAYDKVLIAGPAALERHRSVLIDFDESKLAMVGRPQLDLEFKPEIPSVPARTVMYAPTWEGENEANNYTSLDAYGLRIVEGMLALPGTRVIYKPHPRVESSLIPQVVEAHENIIRAIEKANEARNIPHMVLLQGNILAMFSDIDALVTDVSSVGLDFLYLHPERPLILTDRNTNRGRLSGEAPISRACPIVDADSIGEVHMLVEAALSEDKDSGQRRDMRRYYFGDLAPGDSTNAFTATVDELLTERNQKLEGHEFHAASLEAMDE